MLNVLMESLTKELKLKNIEIEVNLDFFKAKQMYGYKLKEREFLASIYTYYDFINYKSSLDFVNKLYLLLLNDKKFFSITIKDNYNSTLSIEEKVLLVSIIIFKSMTELSTIPEDYYGIIKNSDRVLDSAVTHFNNYLVFNAYPIHSKREMRTIFFKFFEYLIIYKIIIQIKISTRENNIPKTIKMWAIEDNIYYPTNQNYNLLFYPSEIITYNETIYQKGQHFSRVYPLCVENYKSGDSFYIKDRIYMERTVNNRFYPDIQNYLWIRTVIEDENNTTLSELLNDVLIISSQIRRKFADINWNDDIKNDISILQKDYSKKIELITILSFLNLDLDENDGLYFIYYYDFRGRKYVNSPIGPTSSKISRFLFHYGYYLEGDFSDKIEIPRISFYKEKIKQFCEHNNINYQDIYLSIIFWLLIGIGKNVIDKADIYIEDYVFVEKGMSVYEGGTDDARISFIDRMEIKYYIKCLKSLSDAIIRKRIIIKDATASVYQLLLTIVGPKDEESLNYVNLGNCNKYVDTYSWQIKAFRETLSPLELLIFGSYLDLLTRKVIKKTAMTIPYSAGFEICWEDFKKKLSSLNKQQSFNQDCRDMYLKYYNFIKKGMEKRYLYKNTTQKLYKDIIEEFEKKREYYKESSTGRASFRYYKTEYKAIDVSITLSKEGEIIKKRISRQIRKPTTSIDINQTRKALGANMVHFADGDILRELENEIGRSLATIHDCALIDMNSVSKVVLALNKIYQRKIDDLCGPGKYIVNCLFIIL